MVCTVARPDQTFTTAIVVPDPTNLIKFSQEVVGKDGFSVAELCQDDAVKYAVCDNLCQFGIAMGLEKFEAPKKISLVLDEWTPESGLITAAMKLKRKDLETRYSSEIQQMYTSVSDNNTVQWTNKKNSAKVSPA